MNMLETSTGTVEDTTSRAPESPGTLDDIKRAYYAPEQQEAAVAAVAMAQEIAEANNLPVVFNWDTDAALPEGYGVATLPITQRREGVGTVTIGLAIAGVPDPTLCMAHEKGEAWARSVLESALLNKLASAARQGRDGDGPLTLPYSVEDFIVSARGGDSGLTFFRENVKHFVDGINLKLKRKIMNATLLRQVLASAKFAEHQFPTIGQDAWERVLDVMLALAAKNGAEPGIVAVWRKTRNETDLAVADFSVDDIDDAFGAMVD